MTALNETTFATGAKQVQGYDAIVIGAGVSGLYLLYRSPELGLTSRRRPDGAIVPCGARHSRSLRSRSEAKGSRFRADVAGCTWIEKMRGCWSR